MLYLLAFMAGATFGYPTVRLTDDKVWVDLEGTVTHLRGFIHNIMLPDKYTVPQRAALPESSGIRMAPPPEPLHSIVENNRSDYESSGVTTNIVVFSVLATVIVALILISRAPDWLNRIANWVGFKGNEKP